MTKLDVDEINKQKSNKHGAMGLLENILRKFQSLTFAFCIIPLAFIFVICIGIAMSPGAFLVLKVIELSANYSILEKAIYIGISIGAGFVLFIFSLLIVVPIANLPVLPFVKSYRGPWFSLESIPWFYHNALFYLVRYTVLDLVTPTPISLTFLRAMGMKIGSKTMINTSNISDPCLIEVGDHVTIGGSTYLMAHYGMKGFLIIESLKIKSKANVGLHCLLMGAVEVGVGAQILPSTTLLPKTIVPDYARCGSSTPEIILDEVVKP